MTTRDLLEGLSQDDPDATWLSAEAYVFHGTGISPEVFDSLLAQHEEYTRASAIDALLRFEAAILPMVASAIENLSSHASIGSGATYLLAQSPSLRQAVFDTLIANAESAHEARLVVACSTGAVSNDWVAALRLVEPLKANQDLPPQERARLRRGIKALEVMSTLGGWNRVEIAREAQKLTALGPGITDLLLIAANSPERRFRRAIVSALASLADPRATDMLIRTLNDDYTKVRQQAMTGLVRIGEPAVAPLLDAADSDQARIRRYAILCLSRIAMSRPDVAAHVKPTIAGALWDSEEAVRRTAVRAMAKLATPADLKTLTTYLRDASPEHAIEASGIIEGLGVKEPGRSSRWPSPNASPRPPTSSRDRAILVARKSSSSSCKTMITATTPWNSCVSFATHAVFPIWSSK